MRIGEVEHIVIVEPLVLPTEPVEAPEPEPVREPVQEPVHR
jgi:hypothetical protein